ncbi:tRNA 2-thiocytidine biosynthesis protein TtcA [Candidatus Izimaplasma bacterium HR1]|jgi:tRNA(Ile)-lysidine synthase TilS/MesJ|uniref:tRNA 2-thiocytidine biosynthesis TtcA family protein n=1 Tax=Candidatus Izimoplasma sp. HR1 TaxID=1541959 RepID=UPI0004F7ED51|nr:tRNA 2-thiocytidine biosynthesis protein TtcA [Candidatus Izimaplasma bacterium HR1]
MKEAIKKFERDIIKTYRRDIWSKFIKTIQKYDLVQEGDKIAIAMSGGKDSLLMAKLFQELKKHPQQNFEIEFISMDPGYNDENLKLHFQNAERLGVPLNIDKSNIFKVVEKISSDYPCYMCARMRRGFLYNMAKERGCNKLALGHHFDDVIETTMLNMLYAGSVQTMLPKFASDNFEGLELIRPMYLIKERHIIEIMKANDVDTMDCGCEITVCRTSSKRWEVKQLIENLRKTSPDIDKSIFRATENVNVDRIVSWTYKGEKYNRYEKK